MKKYSLLFALISCYYSSFSVANDFSIYCSNSNGDWKWLYESSGFFKNIKIYGEVIEKKKNNLIVNYYINYLKIDGTKENINDLRNKCIKTYGLNYQYPQASKGLTSSGYLLGLSDVEIYPGIYKVYTDIANLEDSVNSKTYFNPQMTSIDLLFKFE